MEYAFDEFPQKKKLEYLFPNFAGSSPPISPKTPPTSLWKLLVSKTAHAKLVSNGTWPSAYNITSESHAGTSCAKYTSAPYRRCSDNAKVIIFSKGMATIHALRRFMLMIVTVYLVLIVFVRLSTALESPMGCCGLMLRGLAGLN